MNKLPIFTLPSHDVRLSLARRPMLPMELDEMAGRSERIAKEPALRAEIARDPRVIFASVESKPEGNDVEAGGAPWFGRMKAVQLPGFFAAENDRPALVVNAAANVNAAVNVNAATKVNVVAVANTAVVNRVLLVNKNWVFGVQIAAPQAWERLESGTLDCL